MKVYFENYKKYQGVDILPKLHFSYRNGSRVLWLIWWWWGIELEFRGDQENPFSN